MQESRAQQISDIVKDVVAATGMKESDVRNKINYGVRGVDHAFRILGIDLTGVVGKQARLDYLMRELKSKFTSE